MNSLVSAPVGLCANFTSAGNVPLVALTVVGGKVEGVIVKAGDPNLRLASEMPDFLGYEWNQAVPQS